ncbi:MAG: hypothetical protein PWQ67_2165 [Clostridia bacterium]|jgi:type II secretion system protein H|nr:hypothetical protein [Clostridia bacterium]MDN5323711.1 hypothetical protein [Clostridia bacterium]
MAVVSKFNFLKKQEGFTLTEMLLVLVILGILAALIFPDAYSIINNHKLQSIAKELVSDMRKTQQLAISKERPFRMIFNDSASSPSNTYYIKDINKNETIKEVQLPSDISIYLSKIIEFYPDGTTQNDTITLQNENNQTLFVVSYMTGRFRITDIEP